MKRFIAIIFTASQLFLGAAVTASAGTTVNNAFTGTVEHISTDNIKVYSPVAHKTRSFLLVPKFDQVFDGDGKTTYQMAKLRPGNLVRVYFDQKLLGVRHADRIIVLNSKEHVISKMKS
jgi:hypothetical protein